MSKRDIIGHGGGKGGGEQHVHYEATDSLHSISYARVMDLISEGEIVGLAKGLESVYLNGTPVANADGSSNFKDITVDFRPGTQDQDYIPGFPSVESETAVGVELRYGTPWTHAITNTALSAIRITLGVPELRKADTSNGDINGYKVDYKIELSTDGGAYAVVLTNSFNGKTTSAYQRSARIDLPHATTGWSVRVTRLTVNGSTLDIADTTNIVSYTEVIDAKLRYPMSAIVGVQVDAKQFQNVPTRCYDMFGRIVQVPSNYDAITRAYTGVWDGTFKPSWTNNPAWIFRDLVLNDRYGMGHRISAAQVDKWALYAIARYCDELVPNGKGGTEPRFTCNVYLQSQKQAYAVLQDLASIFRGISYWGAGTIMASADMPSDPVYVYTAANVVGGKVSRVGSSKKTRYTTALVSWNDMADFGRAKVEYVEDAEGISRYGINQVSLTAFGCTSQGQAQRVGRWALATARLETGMISFDVGMDGAIALPGQIVRVVDPSRMGRRNGGRVRAASGRTVTLDKAPVISVGDALTVILPSGVSETHTVASVSGDAVTVNADWSQAPRAQSVWSVDNSDLSAPLFRVTSVKEKDATTFTISAVQHEPGKYDFVENGVAIQPRDETALDVTKQAAPTSVTVSGYTVSLNDVQKLTLHIECAAVPGAVAYEGAYKRGNGNWLPLARQPGPSFDILDVIADTYTAKLSAVNSIGIASIETVSAATAITKTVDAMYNAAGRLNNALVYAYQRSASAPSGTPGAVDYDFTSKTITTSTLANGWQKTIPTANGNPLYVTVATASSAGATDNIASGEWSSAVILAQDGPGGTGTNGLNTATAFIYQRNATGTTPALPSVAATYNFGATTPLTGLNNGWSATVPPTSSGPYLFVSTATASSNTGSDSIPASEWATVQLLTQDGAPGAAGLNVGLFYAYKRVASAPTDNPGNVSVDFAAGVITTGTLANGWSKTIPTANGNPLYVETIGGSASGTTASLLASGWSGASMLSQDGLAGTNGLNAATVRIYQRSSNSGTAPTLPSGATTYTFASGALTGLNNGWSTAYPAADPAKPYVWSSIATASNTASTDSIAAAEWAAGVLTAQDGDPNGFAALYRWEFQGTDDGWYKANGGTFTNNADSITFASANSDPILASPRPLNFSGAVYNRVRARVKRIAGGLWDGNLYFDKVVNVGEGALGSKFISDTTVIGQWTTLEWDMSGVSGWTGNTIEHIRIDLGAGAADVFEIDWIAIGKYGPPVSQTELAAAQAAADAANAALAAIADDNKLSKGEKPQVIKEYNAIYYEQSGLQTAADSLAVSRSALDSAYAALGTYLSGLGSSSTDWSNTAIDTAIVGATFRSKFTDYYTAKQALLNAMAAKAAYAPSLILGGRNLYKKTTSIQTFGDGSTLTALGTSGFTLNGIVTNNGVVRLHTIPKNGTFTISFDLAVGFASGYPLTLDFCDGTSGTEAPWTINPTTTVQHFEHTFTVSNYSGTFDFIDFNGLSGQFYTFTNFKVEEGNKATAWSPAPEDVQAGIDTAATTSTWTGVTGTGKPADNATVGAPSGTNVAGVPADTVVANASAGAAAGAAVGGLTAAFSASPSTGTLISLSGVGKPLHTIATITVTATGYHAPVTVTAKFDYDPVVADVTISFGTISSSSSDYVNNVIPVRSSAPGFGLETLGTITLNVTDGYGKSVPPIYVSLDVSS